MRVSLAVEDERIYRVLRGARCGGPRERNWLTMQHNAPDDDDWRRPRRAGSMGRN